MTQHLVCVCVFLNVAVNSDSENAVDAICLAMIFRWHDTFFAVYIKY